jgi:hypothetical protein
MRKDYGKKRAVYLSRERRQAPGFCESRFLNEEEQVMENLF